MSSCSFLSSLGFSSGSAFMEVCISGRLFMFGTIFVDFGTNLTRQCIMIPVFIATFSQVTSLTVCAPLQVLLLLTIPAQRWRLKVNFSLIQCLQYPNDLFNGVITALFNNIGYPITVMLGRYLILFLQQNNKYLFFLSLQYTSKS